MSQKYQALEAYETLKDNYNSMTEWKTLRTAAVSLVPADDPMPEDIDSFIEGVLLALATKVKAGWGIDNEYYPLFVRACPLVPRPGVLESSRADTYEEVLTVARRIITTMMSPDPSDSPMYEHGITDPHGTVMVQPFINADASAVVAPNHYIIMGPDNDGVTAGTDGDGFLTAIPCTHDKDVATDLSSLNYKPEEIEIEFVSEASCGRNNIRQALRESNAPSQRYAMVQLRGSDGVRMISPPPKGVTISGTFHGAERITINHIHRVSDNTEEQLDKMEQALREGMPEGSVVLHPNGSHLSHHAGQCLKYGVPYIASVEPKVGEQWTQASAGWVVLDNDGTYKPQPYDPLDYTDEFIEGFNIGFSNFARQHGWLSNHFHQFIGGPLMSPSDTAKLGGAFVAWLINGSLSVGFGELRHITSQTKNATLLPFATMTAIYGVDKWKEVYSHHLSDNRRHYYTMIEKNPATLESVIDILKFAESCYKLDWSGSYGGKKYLRSCRNARMLGELMHDFISKPSKKKFKNIIEKANDVEHAVHNTGFFFNKFISKAALDWGTNPTAVRVQPRNFFTIYRAASDIIHGTVSPTEDYTHIIELAHKTTMKSLKEKPLALHDNALGEAVSYLHFNHRHPMNSKHSQYDSPMFIPCGVSGCERCAVHQQHKVSSVSSDILPIPVSYEADFPVGSTSQGVVQGLKTLSKSDADGKAIAVTLAGILQANTIPSEGHKYVALMVSKFNTEELMLFSKTQKGDE